MIAGNRARERTVSAALASGLVAFAAERGADRAALLAQSGIGAERLADRDTRIPFDRYVALMRAAAALSGDPAFALHFGEAIDLSDISVVGLIGEASETMPDALLQLNRYGKLVIEVDLPDPDRFANQVRGSEIWMVDRRADPDSFPELTDVTFARMICGVRRFAPELRVHAVEVTHSAPGHAAEYERIFRAPVTFGAGWNAFRIDSCWLSLRLHHRPRYAFGILTAHADRLIEALEAGGTLRTTVESLLMPILHTGRASIDAVAAQIGISRQTLYRRLKAEGTTFEAIIDDLRHRLAVDYLSARKVSVNETAYLVGFSDPAAFSRAFKRWTGKAPSHARAG
jgi:AraC-like DNA-binding protein